VARRGRHQQGRQLQTVFQFSELFPGLIPGEPVLFLEKTHQLFDIAVNFFYFVVGEFSPFFADITFHAMPFAFQSILIHNRFLAFVSVIDSGRLNAVAADNGPALVGGILDGFTGTFDIPACALYGVAGGQKCAGGDN
jgi:hypothetical protein